MSERATKRKPLLRSKLRERSRKLFQRRRELLRIEVGDGLRELEQLIKRGLQRLVAFQFRQRGDEPVKREHQTLGAAGTIIS